MTTYIIIAGVLLAVIVIASFAIWRAEKSASTAGAATAEVAQSKAEAKASSAALDAAVQGTDDAQVVDDLRTGKF
jgi:uncharacterized protein YpmB